MEAAKPPRPPPPLPPRLDWFVHTQVAQLAAEGIPEWFHGTISREAAEKLLEPQPAGSFLVRVSHSHVGYTLSCRAPGCYRHFMVKLLDDGRVSGPDGEAHASLDALVTRHRRTPLPPHGDLLTQACPQEDPAHADYADLLLHWRALSAAGPAALGPGDPRGPAPGPEEAPRKPAASPPWLEPSSPGPRQGALARSGRRLWRSLRAPSEAGGSRPAPTAPPPPRDSEAWPEGAGPPRPRGAANPGRAAARTRSWSEVGAAVSRWQRALARAWSSPAPGPRPPEAPLPEEYRRPPPFAPGHGYEAAAPVPHAGR